MVSHPLPGGPPSPARRTWRSWRSAWVDAAYGSEGFWTTQQPGDHFSTAVGAGPLVAQAVAGLVQGPDPVVVDVGAGDARLLTHLADLLPCATLVGVDRRPRPRGLDRRISWVTDHWDVDSERWLGGGPGAWLGDRAAPLLVAHEWLDDLPVTVVERAPGGWHEVEVDAAGHERLGRAATPDDRAWLDRWWDEGHRAEVGRSRDAAWRALVRAALAAGGRALAVDYGHLAGRRPPHGTFAAYGRGRRRRPVPDGSVNLTAAVAFDALTHVSEAAGAATLLLERQADVLPTLPDTGADPLSALVRRSERAALTAPGRWGDQWWLLQGTDRPADLA